MRQPFGVCVSPSLFGVQSRGISGWALRSGRLGNLPFDLGKGAEAQPRLHAALQVGTSDKLHPVLIDIFFALLSFAAIATEVPSVPFADGHWSGEVEAGPTGSPVSQCWASTTFEEGTALTLGKLDDGSWYLRLSNPAWQLRAPQRLAMTIQADFYPEIETVAEVRNQTSLEVADIGRICLLEHIENAHTLKLISDGSFEKYNLEGSAKVMERIRNCMAG